MHKTRRLFVKTRPLLGKRRPLLNETHHLLKSLSLECLIFVFVS